MGGRVKTIMDSGKVVMTEGGEKSVMDFGKVVMTEVVMTEGGRADAAHDLTDEDIKNCNDILQKGDGPLHVEALLGALVATLREVARHRSAVVVDRERIRLDVVRAVTETLDECLPGEKNAAAVSLGHKIADRASEYLATAGWLPAVRDSEFLHAMLSGIGPHLPGGTQRTVAGITEAVRHLASQVDHLTKLNMLAERAMNSAYAFQRLAEERGTLAIDLEIERDGYRSMLADVLATMGPTAPLWARARDLMKNGPLAYAAAAPVDAGPDDVLPDATVAP